MDERIIEYIQRIKSLEEISCGEVIMTKNVLAGDLIIVMADGATFNWAHGWTMMGCMEGYNVWYHIATESKTQMVLDFVQLEDKFKVVAIVVAG